MVWRCMLAVGIAVVSILISVANAKSACNTHYEVRRGDTLSKISRRFYGETDANRIFEANREVIGGDAWLIEIGMKLWIPCADGGVAVAAAPDTASVNRSLAGRAPLKVLSGAVRAPLIGPDLPHNGMLAEMLTEIAADGGFSVEAPVHVPVAGASLAEILTAGGFDVGFPWTRAVCGYAARGGACGEMLFSDPFFDVEMGLYSLREGRFADAELLADLEGARICRPVTVAMDDLDASGLSKSAKVVRLDSEQACLEQLAAGRVDLMGVDAEFADILLERSDVEPNVRRLPVSTRQILYAVVARDNPQAAVIVAEINRGLAGLRQSGRWFAIAHQHMARYPKLALQVQPRG